MSNTHPLVLKLINNQHQKPSVNDIADVAKSIGITDGTIFWALFDYIHKERSEKYSYAIEWT